MPPTRPKQTGRLQLQRLERAGRLQLQNINNGQRSERQQQRRLILVKFNTKHPKKPRAKAFTTKTKQKAASGGQKVTFQSAIDVIPQSLSQSSISGDAIPADDTHSKLDVIRQTNATLKFNGTKQTRSVRNRYHDAASSTPMSPAANATFGQWESLCYFVDTFIDSPAANATFGQWEPCVISLIPLLILFHVVLNQLFVVVVTVVLPIAPTMVKNDSRLRLLDF